MSAFRGQSAFTWVDTDDPVTERVLLLREPVREIRAAHRMTAYVGDSLDFLTRVTFTVSAGVQEVVVRLRYVDDAQGLIDMIAAGTKGKTLTYCADLTDPNRTQLYKLIAPLSPFALSMDPDLATVDGSQEVELTMRTTDE